MIEVPATVIAAQEALEAAHQGFIGAGLDIDLRRGRPPLDSIALSDSIESVLVGGNDYECDGLDVRNYGGPATGLMAVRELFAELLEVPTEWVAIGGNSSLELMFQAVITGVLTGYGGEPPWDRTKARFLCPVPGYDRHFSICEYLGIEMVNVPLTGEGPDMQVVEELVRNADVKGIWCVPRHSNPTGESYSEQTVERIASLGRIAAADFRVFWDNAYAVHDLVPDGPQVASLYAAAEAAGTLESLVLFASFSKVTRAGAAVSALAAAPGTLQQVLGLRAVMTVGADKMNQLRHLRFFQQRDLHEHMQQVAAELAPRFDCVVTALEQLEPGLLEWQRPRGGYFISVNTLPGCARQVVEFCAEAGIMLTPAGAAFPRGRDPDDRNIRLAPTSVSVVDLATAMEVFINAVRLVSARAAASV